MLKHKNIILVGIDGLGGAGKNTLSDDIYRYLNKKKIYTIVFHIDDFINNKETRYNEKCPAWKYYYEIQWRYKYFINDVLKKVSKSGDTDIDVELYDKNSDTYFIQKYNIALKTIVIVEGVFLQREQLKKLFDYIIYIDIPKPIRFARILKRNAYIGSKNQIIEKYKCRYFPAENKYVNEYRPGDVADYVIKYKYK